MRYKNKAKIFIISGSVNTGKTRLLEMFISLIKNDNLKISNQDNKNTNFKNINFLKDKVNKINKINKTNEINNNKNNFNFLPKDNLQKFASFILNKYYIEFELQPFKKKLNYSLLDKKHNFLKTDKLISEKNINTILNTQFDGILSKKVFLDGKHIGYNIVHILDEKTYPLGFKYKYFPDNLEIAYKISKYRFSKIGFDKGNYIVINSIKKGIKNIIIDEIGFLELFHEGFYKGLNFALNQKINLFLIVRDFLVKAFLKEFNINNYYLFKLK